MDTICIPSVQFPDWNDVFCIGDCKDAKHILTMNISDAYLFADDPRCIFSNKHCVLDTLHNKIKFAIWMKNHKLGAYIPTTYTYYSTTDGFYINNKIQFDKCISKPACGACGDNVKIVTKMVFCPNTIYQEYIPHKTYYSHHFLVNKGVILNSVCFASSYKGRGEIVKGRITHYKVVDVDQTVFSTIFSTLSYSGFACADYTIRPDGTIAIFEINPRIGGSLIHNQKYLTEFLATILKLI